MADYPQLLKHIHAAEAELKKAQASVTTSGKLLQSEAFLLGSIRIVLASLHALIDMVVKTREKQEAKTQKAEQVQP